MDTLAPSIQTITVSRLVIGVLALLVSFNTVAESYEATVIGITDGDTVHVLRNSHTEVKIRLSEIDAPEKAQPWGRQSKQALSDLVYRQIVKVDVVTTDRYGRTVAKLIRDDGLDANAEMVRSGNAWVYRKYMLDHGLLDLETSARNAHRGLWSLPEEQIMSPWEWRRQSH
ncbi:MAG: thermonuclease family protein [Gammaproteobacteria bacterium]|nr:thermonuclease family protein [Gammaproteobacteria bacterium]MCP5136357.1 thermonuclease family protein [Gammaproteobacteria bacterium]